MVEFRDLGLCDESTIGIVRRMALTGSRKAGGDRISTRQELTGGFDRGSWVWNEHC